MSIRQETLKIRSLMVVCIVVTLPLYEVLALSPGEAFNRLVESRASEECLMQPDDVCVFELTETAAKVFKFQNVIELPDKNTEFRNLRDLVRIQARAGLFEGAQSVASKIDSSSMWYPVALADITVEHARKGRIRKAFATADMVWQAGGNLLDIVVRKEYIRSLCAIALAQAKSGNEDAKQTLGMAIEIIRNSSEPYAYSIGSAWHHIIEAQLEVEGLFGAQQSLRSMRHAGSHVHWTWIIAAQNAVAMAQASYGLESQARETFSEAIRLTMEADEASGIISQLSSIAVAQVKAGYVSYAKETFLEAVSASQNLEDVSMRVELLSKLSQAQREAGLHDAGGVTANLAVEAARNLVNKRTGVATSGRSYHMADIVHALNDLATAQILAGHFGEAVNSLRRILYFEEKFKFNPALEIYALGMAELAVAQWKVGWEKDSIATINAAHESANSIDPFGSYAVWEAIALAKVIFGDIRSALRIGAQHTGNTRFRIFSSVFEAMIRNNT